MHMNNDNEKCRNKNKFWKKKKNLKDPQKNKNKKTPTNKK